MRVVSSRDEASEPSSTKPRIGSKFNYFFDAERIHPWLVKALLMAFALFCAFVPFEIGFRLWVRYIPQKKVVRDRPLAYYAPEGSPATSDFSYSAVKPANVFRIAAIGDSFTFPTHMQFDDVFPKRLERMLNLAPADKQPLRAEVLNFGRMGASSKSEVDILKQAMKYHPDLVVVEITLNDPEPKNLHIERKKHKGKYDFGPLEITPETHPILYHWKSLGFLVQRVHNSGTLQGVINYYRDMYRPDGRWVTFTKSWERLKRVADRNGVPVVGMVFPLFYTPLDSHYPFLDVHKKITDFLESIHVQNLDLFPAFEGMSPERLIVLPGEDSHPNEIAHRIAADALYNFLEAKRLIPEQLTIKTRYARRGVRPVKLEQSAPTDSSADAAYSEPNRLDTDSSDDDTSDADNSETDKSDGDELHANSPDSGQ